MTPAALYVEAAISSIVDNFLPRMVTAWSTASLARDPSGFFRGYSGTRGFVRCNRTDIARCFHGGCDARISLPDDSMRAVAHDSCNTAQISLFDNDSVIALTRDSFVTARNAAVAPISLYGESRDSFVTASISLADSVA
jgi:hypothetical protein